MEKSIALQTSTTLMISELNRTRSPSTMVASGLLKTVAQHFGRIKIMYYTIYQKKTDPFTQAWTMQSRGWMTFAQVLQTVAALEKRINHPPHALKVTSGKTGDKLVLEWSRIEERNVKVTDEINLLAKSIGYRAELLEAL